MSASTTEMSDTTRGDEKKSMPKRGKRHLSPQKSAAASRPAAPAQPVPSGHAPARDGFALETPVAAKPKYVLVDGTTHAWIGEVVHLEATGRPAIMIPDPTDEDLADAKELGVDPTEYKFQPKKDWAATPEEIRNRMLMNPTYIVKRDPEKMRPRKLLVRKNLKTRTRQIAGDDGEFNDEGTTGVGDYTEMSDENEGDSDDDENLFNPWKEIEPIPAGAQIGFEEGKGGDESFMEVKESACGAGSAGAAGDPIVKKPQTITPDLDIPQRDMRIASVAHDPSTGLYYALDEVPDVEGFLRYVPKEKARDYMPKKPRSYQPAPRRRQRQADPETRTFVMHLASSSASEAPTVAVSENVKYIPTDELRSLQTMSTGATSDYALTCNNINATVKSKQRIENERARRIESARIRGLESVLVTFRPAADKGGVEQRVRDMDEKTKHTIELRAVAAIDGQPAVTGVMATKPAFLDEKSVTGLAVKVPKKKMLISLDSPSGRRDPTAASDARVKPAGPAAPVAPSGEFVPAAVPVYKPAGLLPVSKLGRGQVSRVATSHTELNKFATIERGLRWRELVDFTAIGNFMYLMLLRNFPTLRRLIAEPSTRIQLINFIGSAPTGVAQPKEENIMTRPFSCTSVCYNDTECAGFVSSVMKTVNRIRARRNAKVLEEKTRVAQTEALLTGESPKVAAEAVASAVALEQKRADDAELEERKQKARDEAKRKGFNEHRAEEEAVAAVMLERKAAAEASVDDAKTEPKAEVKAEVKAEGKTETKSEGKEKPKEIEACPLLHIPKPGRPLQIGDILVLQCIWPGCTADDKDHYIGNYSALGCSHVVIYHPPLPKTECRHASNKSNCYGHLGAGCSDAHVSDGVNMLYQNILRGVISTRGNTRALDVEQLRMYDENLRESRINAKNSRTGQYFTIGELITRLSELVNK